MKLVLRLNWLMLVTYVATTGLYLAVTWGLAPALNWWAVFAAYAGYTIYQAVRLIHAAASGASEAAFLGGNLLMDTATVWLVNVPIVGALWLLNPYGGDALVMLYVIQSLAAMSGLMVATIRRPPERRPIRLAPSLIPVSNALFVTLHQTPYWGMIALMNLAVCGLFLLARDQLQAVLQAAFEARQAAEAARDARTRFLASASHDLGQPLQAARLFFDQVEASPPGPARDRAARGLRWAFDATEQLLGQMLEHLRLEAGQVEASIAPVPLGPLIARVAELHEPAARLAGVTLIAMPSRLTAAADARLTERALGNLVANAIRHARAGRVLIGARRHGERLRLWVIDDGVGIAEADVARLFDDHVQGSDHGDEVRGGFGLGLASTRRLAELMHGGAGLAWPRRRGAAFWVELPSI